MAEVRGTVGRCGIARGVGVAVMARRLRGGSYEHGVIYRLCYGDDLIPFYVGESCQPDVREAQHRRGAGSDDQRLVYEATRQMDAEGIEWKMVIYASYGSEGPEALEDEAILETLAEGFALCNMKKGNANWMKQKICEAAEMKAWKMRPREYRARKKELMQPSTTISADSVVEAAKSRRKENPRVTKLKKWTKERLQEKILLMKMTRYKYSDLTFNNEMALLETALAAK